MPRHSGRNSFWPSSCKRLSTSCLMSTIKEYVNLKTLFLISDREDLWAGCLPWTTFLRYSAHFTERDMTFGQSSHSLPLNSMSRMLPCLRGKTACSHLITNLLYRYIVSCACWTLIDLIFNRWSWLKLIWDVEQLLDWRGSYAPREQLRIQSFEIGNVIADHRRSLLNASCRGDSGLKSFSSEVTDLRILLGIVTSLSLMNVHSCM